MAKIRNSSGQALDVPRPFGYAYVGAGEVLEVADDEVWSYTQQTATWAPSGKETQTLHDKAEKKHSNPEPDPEPVAVVAPDPSTTVKES